MCSGRGGGRGLFRGRGHREWGQNHSIKRRVKSPSIVPTSCPSLWNVPSPQEALSDSLKMRRCHLGRGGWGRQVPQDTRLCYRALIPMKELTAGKHLPTEPLHRALHSTFLQLDSPRLGLWWGGQESGRALCRGKSWVVSRVLVLFCPRHQESTINTD